MPGLSAFHSEILALALAKFLSTYGYGRLGPKRIQDTLQNTLSIRHAIQEPVRLFWKVKYQSRAPPRAE